MLRELALVAAETRPYARDPKAINLVSFVKRDATHWRSASWRDSDAGYANGRFAMDINAIWAPRALEAIAAIRAALPAIGIGREALDSLAPEIARGPLAEYLADPTSLRRAIDTWNGARRHFAVTIRREEIERRVGAKLAWLPAAERAYWRKVMAERGEVPDSLAFLALSLDSAGRPIPVVNTDPATELFLDATSAHAVVLDEVEPFLRPYPVGLFVERLGPVAANDAYASRRVWDTFAKDAYHSPKVVWGREVNLLLLGLAGTLGRASDPSSSRTRAGPRTRFSARLRQCAPPAWSTTSSGATGSRVVACCRPAMVPAPTCSSGAVPISPCSSSSPGSLTREGPPASPHVTLVTSKATPMEEPLPGDRLPRRAGGGDLESQHGALGRLEEHHLDGVESSPERDLAPDLCPRRCLRRSRR